MRLVSPPKRWQRPDLRLTVDTEADLALVEHILVELGLDANLDHTIPYLESHPETARMNSSVEQQGWAELKDRKERIGKQ
jgi:spore coat polysaccharide biosynthesis protein SpsF (cytidylyltransferase family)